ncbi:long-chain-fatty-acid--CoA ligase [Roseomonas sp. GC11]|uniref:long-chain-fatty-acid--CoA ligase n=1 Tax=Roseomonas sp. GC11 TaxID=2950546 RepID=UPI00210BE9F7|nr:long-chain-fatty-acid--CoA ligase [Roseomonas sp. GC11]MCQ4160185.1 long-chain-fatty-acid--CoA ligase [Roseomonas sp. GC11]
MRGLMMDVPLLVSAVLRHAAETHGETEIVSRTVEGPIHRTTYAALHERSQRLAKALLALGLGQGGRVGTLAWNGYRHLEIYYAAGGAGLVCHTINPRLFPEQIAGIIRHAEDEILCADLTFLPLLAGLAGKLGAVRAIVVMTDRAHMPPPPEGLPPLLCYEELLAAQPPGFDWPALDENTACGLCYTSGTTGMPKGVLYSHRSCVLHALGCCLPDVFELSARSVIMPAVPMFHVNAWGTPYSAPMVGAKLVLPGPKLDGASLRELILSEGVTFSAGVPTVWMGLLDWLDAQGEIAGEIAGAQGGLGALRLVGIGGSACPPVVIERLAARGVTVRHAWGMTETSPVALTSAPQAKHEGLPPRERLALSARQGRPLYGVEFRVLGADGQPVARDGVAFGRLLVRGPWVAAAYHGLEDSPAHATEPGWFDTGDVATVDADGYVCIVDRTKDVIKSGGEWISSIELENIAVSHPAVQEAAAVARPDPKWGERPLLVLVRRPGVAVTAEEIRAHFHGRVARWCIPEDIRFAEELPHTATGKLLKSRIRELYAEAMQAAGN